MTEKRNKPKLGLFSVIILVRRFPSVFLPCSTLQFFGIFCALHYAILKNNYHNIGYCLVLVGVYSVKWCFQTTCASLLLKITHRSYEVNVCLMLSSFLCQVSQKSPNLTVFKGYVMKLRLNCTKYPILSSSNKTRTKDLCLLFKVKGEVQCKYC